MSQTIKPKIKPAAKIVIAALIVGVLLYSGFLFNKSKESDKKEIIKADTMQVRKDTIQQIVVPVTTEVNASSVLSAPVANTSVQSSQVVSQSNTTVKKEVKKHESKSEAKSKPKKDEARENLNVDFK